MGLPNPSWPEYMFLTPLWSGPSKSKHLSALQESQAKAQANIWLVLVGASSQLKDQITAFSKAMNVLQAAMQPEVVEVRMQFADWLLRSGFPISDALEQLGAASDLLLEIEEGSEDEEEEEGGDARYYSGVGDRADHDSDDGGSSVAPSDWDKSQSNFGSKKGSRSGSRMGSSRAGSMAGSKAGSRKSGAGSKAGSQSSRMSKNKKGGKKKLGKLSLWGVNHGHLANWTNHMPIIDQQQYYGYYGSKDLFYRNHPQISHVFQ